MKKKKKKNRSIIRKRQAILIVSLSVVSFALAIALGIGLVRTAKEEKKLLDEQSKIAATAPPAGTEGTPDDGTTHGYLRLAEGNGMLFIFGDEAIYGRGLKTPLAYDSAGSFTSIALSKLREEYGLTLRAGAIRDVLKPHTLSYAVTAVRGLVETGTPPSVILLAPSDDTRVAGQAITPDGYSFVGDLESAIRAMRSYSPHADILLVIPVNASTYTASSIAVVAEYYDLLTVDLRTALGNDPALIHTSGEDVGFPTEAGHRVAALAITEAVELAVREGYTSPPMPKEWLFTTEQE